MKRLRHPVRAIREPFGTAGLIVACVALIAALAGGAYAASGGLTAKQKKEVKKIAKQFAGKPGAPGPAGAPGAKGDAGAAGANGQDGTNGTNGSNGSNGTNGEAGMCSAGNSECKLPAGGVLTGVWSASGGAGDLALASISFPLRVSPAPTAAIEEPVASWTLGWQLEDGKLTLVGPYPCFEGCSGEGVTEQDDPLKALDEAQEAWEAACPGTAAAPKASAGFLCIYKKDQTGNQNGPTALKDISEGAHEFGVTVAFKMIADGSYIRGSWAVKK